MEFCDGVFAGRPTAGWSGVCFPDRYLVAIVQDMTLFSGAQNTGGQAPVSNYCLTGLEADPQSLIGLPPIGVVAIAQDQVDVLARSLLPRSVQSLPLQGKIHLRVAGRATGLGYPASILTQVQCSGTQVCSYCYCTTIPVNIDHDWRPFTSQPRSALPLVPRHRTKGFQIAR